MGFIDNDQGDIAKNTFRIVAQCVHQTLGCNHLDIRLMVELKERSSVERKVRGVCS
nr:hypothetical protein [Glycomyces sp. NEAU-S30]